MNRLSLTAVAGGMIVLASCSQEDVTKAPQKQEPYPISFRAGVATRVNPDLDYTNNPATFYVTAFANSHTAVNGVLPNALFTDEPFYMMGANLYASTSNQKWPSSEEASTVEFFAYAPSLEEIKNAALTQLDPNASNYQTLLGNYNNGIKFYNQCIDGNSLDPLNQENTTFAGVQLYKGFKLGRFYV
ncbi:MAG: fimbrillin family protein, partial [Muribaculaceae bacterium]|nr:fimbrillin family protein [Muribaculaceae bacterium]